MAKSPDNIVSTLYGSSVKFKRAVAFCKHHHCYLTAAQVKTKGCLGKGCRHINKLPHQYWEDREKKKILKKEAKRND